MAKKTVYLDNALAELVAELQEKIADKKVGDRLSISAYYGNSGKLFRQSEVDASVCRLYKDTGTGLEQLPGDKGARIVLRLVAKEEFEKLFSIKESKPEPKPAKVKAETSEPVPAETSEPVPTETPAEVREAKTEYKTISAFEQVKELIPSLTTEEKQELLKLLKS